MNCDYKQIILSSSTLVKLNFPADDCFFSEHINTFLRNHLKNVVRSCFFEKNNFILHILYLMRILQKK